MNDRVMLFGVGAGLVLVAAAMWAARTAAAKAGAALNPLSSGNAVYSGVSGVGAAVSGNPDWSLGTWLWELTNQAQLERERAAVGATPPFNPGSSGATGSW